MLKDKVCVITGSARGIGYAIAEEFAKNGAKVVLSDVLEDTLDIVIVTVILYQLPVLAIILLIFEDG